MLAKSWRHPRRTLHHHLRFDSNGAYRYFICRIILQIYFIKGAGFITKNYLKLNSSYLHCTVLTLKSTPIVGMQCASNVLSATEPRKMISYT
jgi:hypothetical protein